MIKNEEKIRIKDFEEWVKTEAVKICKERGYDNIRIEDIKFDFRKGFLKDVFFKKGVWYGQFSGEGLPRPLLINPKPDEVRKKRHLDLYAQVSFNVNQEKNEAQDLVTGSLVTTDECRGGAAKKMRLVCPSCKVKYSYIKETTMIKTGRYKTDFFRSKANVWCCQNTMNISVLRINKEKEDYTKEEEIEHEKESKVKKASAVILEGEEFSFLNGLVYKDKELQTDKLVYYREFFIKNWDTIINTLEFKDYYIFTSYNNNLKIRKAKRIKTVENMQQIIKEHLEITVDQINKNKIYSSSKAVIDVNIEMLDYIKDNVALWDIMKSGAEHNKNIDIIKAYQNEKDSR